MRSFVREDRGYVNLKGVNIGKAEQVVCVFL